MKCNGSCPGNSAAGVLTQLSEASNSSIDEQDNKVDDTISIISSTSTGSMSTSEARYGDSSSATTILMYNTSTYLLIHTSKFYTCTVALLIFMSIILSILGEHCSKA